MGSSEKTIEMSGMEGPVLEASSGLSNSSHIDGAASLITSPHLKRQAGQGEFKGATVLSGVANLSTSIIGAGTELPVQQPAGLCLLDSGTPIAKTLMDSSSPKPS